MNATGCESSNLLVKVGVGDEYVICFSDFINVEVLWQYIWTIEPSIEENDETIRTKTICGCTCGLNQGSEKQD